MTTDTQQAPSQIPPSVAMWEQLFRRSARPSLSLQGQIREMLVDAILRYVYGGVQAAVAAKAEPKPVPDNLKRFFAAKNS